MSSVCIEIGKIRSTTALYEYVQSTTIKSTRNSERKIPLVDSSRDARTERGKCGKLLFRDEDTPFGVSRGTEKTIRHVRWLMSGRRSGEIPSNFNAANFIPSEFENIQNSIILRSSLCTAVALFLFFGLGPQYLDW